VAARESIVGVGRMAGNQSTEHERVYDTLIVGAGMAGLYCAAELSRRRRHRIAVLERYKFLGGRTFTYEADVSGVHYQWEEGAARISETHTLLLRLLREHGLHWDPISRAPAEYRTGSTPPIPDPFEAALPVLLEGIQRMPRDQLGKTTLAALLESIHGRAATKRMLDLYP
jgi:protoporphyrinogen oxidase